MPDPLNFLYRPAEPSNSKRLLILLHGLGSSEEDLFGLVPYIPAGYHFYCLQAPMDYFGGYKWFSIEILPGKVVCDLEEAKLSCELVVDTVQAIQERHGISTEDTCIGGFSQGAIISTAIVLRCSNLAGAAWLMSGACLPELIPSDLANYSAPLRALVQHGEYDEVLPLARGRETVDVLRSKIAADVQLKIYPIYHSISAESLSDAKVWLST